MKVMRLGRDGGIYVFSFSLVGPIVPSRDLFLHRHPNVWIAAVFDLTSCEEKEAIDKKVRMSLIKLTPDELNQWFNNVIP